HIEWRIDGNPASGPRVPRRASTNRSHPRTKCHPTSITNRPRAPQARKGGPSPTAPMKINQRPTGQPRTAAVSSDPSRARSGISPRARPGSCITTKT
ncbi:hypothetical protein LTR33_018389, partial [Friedmanniomyces endolithicus]